MGIFLKVLRRRLLLGTPVAILVAGFFGDSAQAGPITWNISTIAQAGSVAGGYSVTPGLTGYGASADSSLAPNDDYVAYQASYSQNGTSHSGIFASDGTAVAVAGEQIGGKTLNLFLGVGPYVNDSHSVLFMNLSASGYDDIFTGTALLSGDTVTNQHGSFYHSGLLGYSDSGAFLGDYQNCCSVSYFGGASGPLYAELYSGNPYSAASNNSGAGVYNVGNDLYDLQNNHLAGPGTVIAGITLSSVGYGGGPVAINNSGTVAFVGYWNAGANCGIFSLTTLLVDTSGHCGTELNINDNGEVAWLSINDVHSVTNLYTQYGLVSSSAVNVGARFLNNLGDLTFENTAGQVELATQVSAAPEPGTVWLALTAMGAGWAGKKRKFRQQTGSSERETVADED